MKKFFSTCLLFAFLLSCNNEKEGPGESTATAENSEPDLPYKAAYSGNFNDNVSDADLKTVLMTYKDWETGNMSGLANGMSDSVVVDMSNGNHLEKTRDELMKIWSDYRDSLSSVKIVMQAWRKMHEPSKNESAVAVWYDEWDTYKDGRVDSASYHDINGLKDGKINWYAQYKRPKK